jgi:tRNA threonylcarbamoyladenosine biosynthesis protein TsaE
MVVRNETKITHSAEETQKFAREFATHIQPGDVVMLIGELGSGKTTFMQGFAQGLQIIQNIISPTFIIMRTYPLPTPIRGIQNLYHLDLYRIESEKDVIGLGIEEALHDTESVIAIEWPEKMGSLLPKKRNEFTFVYKDENTREITMKSYE